ELAGLVVVLGRAAAETAVVPADQPEPFAKGTARLGQCALAAVLALKGVMDGDLDGRVLCASQPSADRRGDRTEHGGLEVLALPQSDDDHSAGPLLGKGLDDAAGVTGELA